MKSPSYPKGIPSCYDDSFYSSLSIVGRFVFKERASEEKGFESGRFSGCFGYSEGINIAEV